MQGDAQAACMSSLSLFLETDACSIRRDMKTSFWITLRDHSLDFILDPVWEAIAASQDKQACVVLVLLCTVADKAQGSCPSGSISYFLRTTSMLYSTNHRLTICVHMDIVEGAF